MLKRYGLVRRGPAILMVLGLIWVGSAPAGAQDQPATPSLSITLAWVQLAVKRSYPETYLDQPPTDEGLQGARLGLADTATTGRFIGQDYQMTEIVARDEAGIVDGVTKALDAGKRFFVLDVPPALLLKLADLPAAKDATLIDATSEDDSLRAADCRANVLHVMPSRAMLADALMQYLVTKNWRHAMLLSGRDPADKLYADAIRKSARKFQVTLAADQPWTFNPTTQQADTGHFQVNAEVAKATQGYDYDVLIVADEADNFGDSLTYRTFIPRPVAGTQGLVPGAWARAYDEYGSTQLQARFLRKSKRWMTDRDWAAWVGVRSIGEAVTRTSSADPKVLAAFLHGPAFSVAGYKGAELSYRVWDGQLRQPILLNSDRSLVDVAPLPGFLHQFNDLDTLGVDQPESQCHMH